MPGKHPLSFSPWPGKEETAEQQRLKHNHPGAEWYLLLEKIKTGILLITMKYSQFLLMSGFCWLKSVLTPLSFPAWRPFLSTNFSSCFTFIFSIFPTFSAKLRVRNHRDGWPGECQRAVGCHPQLSLLPLALGFYRSGAHETVARFTSAAPACAGLHQLCCRRVKPHHVPIDVLPPRTLSAQ